MNLNKVVVAIGIVSIAVGMISRFMRTPIPPMGLEAEACLQFAASCFLLSIALSMMSCKK